MLRITSVVINGREYERREGRSQNRWTYLPTDNHKRVWVHGTSRLHHALERLAGAEERIWTLENALQDFITTTPTEGPGDER